MSSEKPFDSETDSLPNFCHRETTSISIILATLLGLMITIISIDSLNNFWGYFGLISLYLLWLVLSFSVIVCYLRPHLNKLSTAKASMIAFGILLLVQALLNEVVLYLLPLMGVMDAINIPHDFRWRSLVVGFIIGGMALHYYYLQHQWRRRTRAASQYRVEALQARIRPHFLFNSLNTVTSLIHNKPDEAEEALLDISDLFRESLRSSESKISLQQELDLTRRYLHIEQLRLGERLRISWDITEGVDTLLIPPFILQPLVENAIYHGIERLAEGGEVLIQIHIEANQLQIMVRNPMVIPEPKRSDHQGAHMALANIRSRVETLEPQPGAIETNTDNLQFKVMIKLPLIAKGVA